ncbi:hypothetical protein [Roseinatronobacter alkalisoli]|uniref:Uncharacterized protein n=1 Tax=Roseinatronobacter alkalisoli TaxID=3028235 RepID=A0ABT5TFA6_9RHOB|nr:hypothetical protein [Roseinatronobacter sp. HJB301]MDD7973811.1 hypothetical protein [Roseinatronobacter sp. HJB301]
MAKRRIARIGAIDPVYADAVFDSAPPVVARAEQRITQHPQSVAQPIAQGQPEAPARVAPPTAPVAPRVAQEGATMNPAISARKPARAFSITLWPLQRHKDDLQALEKDGYRIELILSAAMKSARQSFKPKPAYVPAQKGDWWTAYSVRLQKPVPDRILMQLTESAKDPGAMMATQLLRGQIEPLWLDALDALIERLKAALP